LTHSDWRDDRMASEFFAGVNVAQVDFNDWQPYG
jgi:hypothetical protein